MMRRAQLHAETEVRWHDEFAKILAELPPDKADAAAGEMTAADGEMTTGDGEMTTVPRESAARFEQVSR